MTVEPSPLLEYRPLNHHALTLTAVTGLSTEQVQAIRAPFVPTEKPKAVATLSSFSVTCDLSGVTLPEHYRLRVFVWVVGAAQALAPVSYNPMPSKPLKSKLWRLTPDVTGGEAEDAASVTLNLPQPYPVARIEVEVRGLFDTATMYAPTEL